MRPPKYGELDRLTLAVLEGFHRIADMTGKREIPHLVGDVVATVGLLTGFLLLTIAT